MRAATNLNTMKREYFQVKKEKFENITTRQELNKLMLTLWRDEPTDEEFSLMCRLEEEVLGRLSEPKEEVKEGPTSNCLIQRGIRQFEEDKNRELSGDQKGVMRTWKCRLPSGKYGTFVSDEEVQEGGYSEPRPGHKIVISHDGRVRSQTQFQRVIEEVTRDENGWWIKPFPIRR